MLCVCVQPQPKAALTKWINTREAEAYKALEREIQLYKVRDRPIDRRTDRQTDRQTDGQRHTHIYTNVCTYICTASYMDGWVDGLAQERRILGILRHEI